MRLQVCTKYDSDAKEGKVSVEERGIVENQKLLQKYSYYYKRFKTSADAIKITRKLGDDIEKKMKDADLNKYHAHTHARQQQHTRSRPLLVLFSFADVCFVWCVLCAGTAFCWRPSTS